jgi:hypothetical protein
MMALHTSSVVRRKKGGRRWMALLAECVGHGQCGRFVLGIAGDGKTQEEQEPFANSAVLPIPGTELLHLSSRHFGDRLHVRSLRRNGGAMFTHRPRLDRHAVLFQNGAELSILRRCLRVEPYGQYACRT